MQKVKARWDGALLAYLNMSVREYLCTNSIIRFVPSPHSLARLHTFPCFAAATSLHSPTNTANKLLHNPAKKSMPDKPIANPDLSAPPTGRYPAKDHCRRVAKWISENGGPSSGVIYLEGMGTHMKEVSM